MKYKKCPTCGFATIYETSKPNSGTGKRRVRQKKASKPKETNAAVPGCEDVQDSSEETSELSCELLKSYEGPEYSLFPKYPEDFPQ